jgi:hypoxanthine-guanine phosphoribosyltransferase
MARPTKEKTVVEETVVEPVAWDEAPKVVEAFGKFMAEIDGQIVTFDDKNTAETAVALNAGKEEMKKRAAAYCTAKGLVDKNAKAKTTIILDFLAFEAIPVA